MTSGPPRGAGTASPRLDIGALERLFALTTDAVFVDHDGVIVAANRASADLYGTTEEALIGERSSALVPEPDRDRIEARVARLRRGTERDRWAEEEILRVDGVRVPVVVRSTPVTHDGEPAMLVIIRDMTEQRRNEHDLARGDALFQLLTDVTVRLAVADEAGLDDAIVSALADIARVGGVERGWVHRFDDHEIVRSHSWFAGGIVCAADPAARIRRSDFPYMDRLLTGGHVVHIPDASELGEEAQRERRVLERSEIQSALMVPMVLEGRVLGGIGMSSTLRRRTWSDREIEMIGSLARLVALSLTRRDTAEAERSARDEAIRANAAKDLFLSRMSHELRTPLNAVLGFTELLLTEDRNPRERMMLEQVLTSGAHLLRLVEDVLDISRIVSGRPELRWETVSVDEVVAGAVAMVVQGGEHRAGAPDLVVERSGLEVRADRARLQQILVNLVSNAVKYNVAHGEVAIGAERRITDGSPTIRIWVRDTGVGIAAGEIERIFEPFERGGASTAVSGAGIGLAVSRSLLEAMGGTISVRSTPGEGSVFIVDLPDDNDDRDDEVAGEAATTVLP